MKNDLTELWQARELLFTLVERELRIRYKNSILGFLWSLLNPLLTVSVMWFVFKFYMANETPNFSAYILAAYLPYMFFQQAVLDSAQSVLQALPIVKKVYFPREILPIAVVCSSFVHFLLALCVFFAFLLVIYLSDPRVSPFSWNMLLLPIPLILSFLLAAGTGLFIAALNTFFEDVKYIVQVLLQLLLFVCPIMYFSEQVLAASQRHGTWMYFAYHANPVAMLCTAFRKILVAPQDPIVGGKSLPWLPLDWALMVLCAAVCVSVFVGGYAYFNRVKWGFVERP
ncbi:MAG: ABC transporter permease [Chthonomonas sp.]|nr:ABC transporter permease [Chthonomonas sp.]